MKIPALLTFKFQWDKREKRERKTIKNYQNKQNQPYTMLNGDPLWEWGEAGKELGLFLTKR